MEGILNIIWLGLALGIVAGWIGQRTRSRAGHLPDVKLQAVALVCLLVFLFFPISISDDLQWNLLATEAEGSWKVIKSLASAGGAGAALLHVSAVLPAVISFAIARMAIPVERFEAIGSPAAGFCQDFSGRSPPCFC